MRIIFAGTPEFACIQLKAIVEAGYTIDLVLTQPDRAAGRGQKLTPTPVKVYATEHNIKVLEPFTLKEDEIYRLLQSFAPDLMIVSAYGIILPKRILELPKLGCWNVHASLLPRWRGAAPIQHAILHGDSETGICIMQMDEGLDTGPVLKQAKIAVAPLETASSLHDKLAQLGAKILLECLASDLQKPQPQPKEGTYAPKITKEQAHIVWSYSSAMIERMIRAYNPWPTAFTWFKGERIKILQSSLITEHAYPAMHPGTIMEVSAQGLAIATGDGILQLSILQLPGKKPLPFKDIFNAKPYFFQKGEVLT